ncbi:hypothetical protein SteCoe_12206 [Stentor coeruleus]|uniref:TRP C-terminal domain-containing protein n=1 Tax=Stentor coeruleus TaxID=5963 RepID=A0A1R2CBA5_9CILI|nr:hypothetical protein SteCoe_12206 [Stentor coeruleus]
MMVLPILLYIASWICYGLLKFTARNIYLKFYRTTIFTVSFVLAYPFILTYLFSPFACMSLINGKPENFDEHVNKNDYPQYLIENRNIECNFEHYKKIKFAALFGIIIWGAVVPGYIFYQIYKKKESLFEFKVKIKYGFLFNGYLNSSYYWEFIILSKKLIIVFITVFMERDYDSRLQSFLIIASLLFFMNLQINFRPYFNEKLNNLELYASIVVIITVLLSFIYEEFKNEFSIEYILISVFNIMRSGLFILFILFTYFMVFKRFNQAR